MILLNRTGDLSIYPLIYPSIYQGEKGQRVGTTRPAVENDVGSGSLLWKMAIWVWVNTYRYIFSGMNIHLPAILGFTRYQGFDPSPY